MCCCRATHVQVTKCDPAPQGSRVRRALPKVGACREQSSCLNPCCRQPRVARLACLAAALQHSFAPRSHMIAAATAATLALVVLLPCVATFHIPACCLPPLPHALQSTGKPRVICLTAKRRSKKRGFKGTLHVCKLAQGRYQASCCRPVAADQPQLSCWQCGNAMWADLCLQWASCQCTVRKPSRICTAMRRVLLNAHLF